VVLVAVVLLEDASVVTLFLAVEEAVAVPLDDAPFEEVVGPEPEELGAEEELGLAEVEDDGAAVELDGAAEDEGPVPSIQEAVTPVELVHELGTDPGPPATNLIAAH
jgi:hypothetical protein